MSLWHTVCELLPKSAAMATAALIVGGAAAVLCREPARRLRILEWTLAACLVAPALCLWPGWNRWTSGWWPTESAPIERLAIADATNAVSPVEEIRVDRLEEPASDAQPTHEDSIDKHDEGEKADNADNADEAAIGDENVGPILPAPADDPVDAQDFAEASPASASPARESTWPEHVALAWLVGAGALLAWSCVGLIALARLLRGAVVAPTHVADLLWQVAGPAARRARILVSPRASQPFTFAWRRPTIVLPADMVRTADAARADDNRGLRWCLAHEWSHVERGDPWSWLLAGVVRTLYFYHPLVWFVRRQVRLQQDYLADAAAANQGEQIEDYAEFLLDRIKQSRFPRAIAGLGMASNRSDFSRRIQMLILRSGDLNRTTPKWWNAALAATAVAACLGLAAAVQPSQPADAQEDKPAEAAKSAEQAKKPGRSARVPKDELVYEGKTFEAWARQYERELSNEARGKCLTAIASFAPHGYAKEIVDLLKEDAYVGALKVQILNLLAECGEPGLPLLVEGLQHKDEHVRRICAYGLSTTNAWSEDFIPQLIELLDDAAPKVQAMACDALRAKAPNDARVIEAAIRVGSDVLRDRHRWDGSRSLVLARFQLLFHTGSEDPKVVEVLRDMVRRIYDQIDRQLIQKAFGELNGTASDNVALTLYWDLLGHLPYNSPMSMLIDVINAHPAAAHQAIPLFAAIIEPTTDESAKKLAAEIGMSEEEVRRVAGLSAKVYAQGPIDEQRQSVLAGIFEIGPPLKAAAPWLQRLIENPEMSAEIREKAQIALKSVTAERKSRKGE